MIKILNKLGIKRNFFNLIACMKSRQLTPYLVVKDNASEIREGYPLLPLLLNIVLEGPARAIRQEMK